MQLGGRRVMREQLHHLCRATGRDNVELRVLPA
ncbi:Scr1 family TA system antitoxin-like transcriptional regulator [Streptomyces tendae]|nr:Scr1 family TA system antitoxin-like transcriptional regulator [Streptomyces tendae]